MANASSKGYRLIDCEPLLGSDMNYCPLAFGAHRFRASEKGVGRMKDQKIRFRSCTPRRWGWGTPLKNVQAPESSKALFFFDTEYNHYNYIATSFLHRQTMTNLP